MTAEQARKGRLRFVAGAGRPREIPDEAAAGHSGKVEDVLRKLVAEGTIQDPQREYATMLRNPRVVFELSSEGPDGQDVETPLASDEAWDKVLKGLQEGKDQEIGMAVSHKGGAIRPRATSE